MKILSLIWRESKMKKTICIFIILVVVFLVSCSTSNVTDTLSSQTSEIITETESTTVKSTDGTHNTENTATTESSFSETATSSLESTTSSVSTTDKYAVVGQYNTLREVKFEKLFRLAPTYRLSNDKWYINASQKNDVKNLLDHFNYLIFTVGGYTGIEYNTFPYHFSEYYVYKNSYGDYLSDSEVYRIKVRGTLEEPGYGLFRMEIGEKYISIFSDAFAELIEGREDLDFNGIVFRIDEVDGIEWVYPSIDMDLSSMKCAVKISDPNERLFYKPGTDDDIIAYLNENKIPNPEIDYKCKLDEFINEISNAHVVDTKNVTPVGEYSSILEAFPFESFAEFPENMRLDVNHPYIPKETIDVTTYKSNIANNKDTIVTILGYRNSEIGNDGMVYSYYYVYAEPLFRGTFNECHDDTVYIMQAYGSPSHPYYGQRRIEIGDRFIRLETDASFYQTDEILTATKLFYLIESSDSPMNHVVADFGTDLSKIIAKKQPTEEEAFVYSEGRDDDVIRYLTENKIEIPIYNEKVLLTYFSTEMRVKK